MFIMGCFIYKLRYFSFLLRYHSKCFNSTSCIIILFTLWLYDRFFLFGKCSTNGTAHFPLQIILFHLCSSLCFFSSSFSLLFIISSDFRLFILFTSLELIFQTLHSILIAKMLQQIQYFLSLVFLIQSCYFKNVLV